MTFLVTWSGLALAQLSAIRASAEDPSRIDKASDWIDYTLRRTPNDMGESREEGIRLWYGDVLGVQYRVDESSQTVEILKLGLARR